MCLPLLYIVVMKLVCGFSSKNNANSVLNRVFIKLIHTIFAIFEPGLGWSPGFARKNLNGYHAFGKVVPKNMFARGIYMRALAHAHVPSVACVKTPLPSGN